MIRRQPLALRFGSLCAAALLVLAGCGSPDSGPGEAASAGGKPFAGQVLKVATFGGGWQDATVETVGKWFEQTTGAKVEYITGNPRDHLAKLLAGKGQAPPFDIMQVDDAVQAEAAAAGMLESIPSDITTVKELMPGTDFNPPYGPAMVLTQYGIAYNTDLYKELQLPPPQRISDLWNPKLKGKVAIPGLQTVMGPFGLAAVALEFGGSMENVDQALAKYHELDPIVYTNSSKLESQFVNGEVAAAIWIDGRALTLRDSGYPISFVKPVIGNGGVVGMAGSDVVAVAKGTKKLELARVWLERQYSLEAQVAFAKLNNYGATNAKAAAELAQEPKYKGQFIASAQELEKTMRIDNRKVNAALPAWIEQWNKVLSQ